MIEAATLVAGLPAKFKALISGYVLEVVKVTDYGAVLECIQAVVRHLSC